MWREGGDLEKLSGGHGRGEEGRRKRKRRRERGTDGGGRECGEERSYCGRVLRWCNPHLLRGRIVIASRERDGCMIFNFYYFYFYNMGPWSKKVKV